MSQRIPVNRACSHSVQKNMFYLRFTDGKKQGFLEDFKPWFIKEVSVGTRINYI